jgi:4-amino-4-deoxy-L-arabinose transferase-like glycosyltransferase
MSDRARTQTQLLAGLLMLLALSLLIRLGSWPPTWSGEGAHLQAAKNLALHGRYALLSGDAFRPYDPMLAGAGPTVLLPAAALLRLFGIGLVQGRLVSVVYALAAIGLCYNLAARMMDARAALVATALMVWSPWGSFLQMGRLAAGQMASLAFVLLGLALLWRSIDRASFWPSLGCGVAFCLAALSEQQSVVVVGALLVVGVADLTSYRRLGLRRWGVPLLVMLLMLAAWLSLLGVAGSLSGWLRNLQTYSLATVFRPGRVLANFNNLAMSGYLLWAVPGIVYLALEMVRKGRDGLRECALLALVCVWLLWFVFASIGWVHLAFVPVSLTALLLGRLFGDLTEGFGFDLQLVQGALRGAKANSLLSRLSLALLPLVAIGYGVLLDVDGLLNEADWSAQEMARYLDERVPSDALVETWEWELSFLGEGRFHLPPFEVTDDVIRQEQFGTEPAGGAYSLEAVRPEYVVEGPWSFDVGLYEDYIEERCALETHVGPYDLYACDDH